MVEPRRQRRYAIKEIGLQSLAAFSIFSDTSEHRVLKVQNADFRNFRSWTSFPSLTTQ